MDRKEPKNGVTPPLTLYTPEEYTFQKLTWESEDIARSMEELATRLKFKAGQIRAALLINHPDALNLNGLGEIQGAASMIDAKCGSWAAHLYMLRFLRSNRTDVNVV